MPTKILQKLFEQKNIPDDAQKILRDFDQIAQSAIPSNSKQLVALPKQIRELSHQMTDDRSSRRLGYMNEKTFLVSYVRYFMWWNLVRLTRLFANLDFSFLRDGDFCLDVGSGPLTLPCALWLSRPDLRQKKLVWHVMDISQGALSLGEEIFLSLAAATGGEPWKIVRVKGSLGTSLKQKTAFVTCANMFNEIIQSQTEPPDFLAKKYSQALFKYLDFSEGANPALLLVEPGVPKSARFVSLMRDAFIRRGFSISAPCPHQGECPMDGRRAGQNGGNGKWCNFAFETDDAPKKLLALSAKAGIPKERAVLSFVFAQTLASPKKPEISDKPKNSAAANSSLLRIASDIIRIPAEREGQKARVGHYACSERGLVLALSTGGLKVYSGDLLETEASPKSVEEKSLASPKSGRRDFRQDQDFRRSDRFRQNGGRDFGRQKASRDAKSGAVIVEI